ncbi:hypothetical protein J6590_029098 [Homalodisca vitripennis]|nr:hypothetical protein J6590_029098 [Homalodisca vitripennis]
MSRKLVSFSTHLVGVNFSSAPNKMSCRLLVCGGGSGGCSIAAKFASKLPKGSCIIVEPKDTHYYQPMWTLVGGGMKTLEQSGRPMKDVLPKSATWIKESVVEFHPAKNYIVTSNGTEISYEYMVVALGLDLHYDAIPGLEDALAVKDSGVCSNYSNKYVNRTLQCVKDFKSGNAIFTFPNTPIKCAGAPQKACYITDALLRKYGKRDKAKLKYKTSLPVIFGVKKYADSLWEVCKKRDIEVGLRQELIEVKLGSKEAVFRNIDKPTEIQTESFEMLHVCPPMSAPKVLRKCPDFTDGAGYLSVNKDTLQHTVFKNVFGIGDCSNLPTSKTAAAIAGQNGVVGKNLSAVMADKPPTAKYDGYTSCPLVTGLDRCILAEFDYSGQPLETFPIDQGKERYTSFLIKRDILPIVYWNGMLNGYWNGPGVFRKLFRLGRD